jgi:cation diffusion facilitator family transporter
MSGCCEDKACEIDRLRDRQTRTLKIILAINAVMFFVEAAAGLAAHSTALLADSLDMLGDALVYAFSLYVVARTARWKAGSALLKGLIQFGFGAAVLAIAVYKILNPVAPDAGTIGAVGLLALAANSVCAWLLLAHRREDINMHSVWLCSRNDLIHNLAVIAAGIAVALTGSRWPDIAVGLAIAALFLQTSFGVISRSLGELRRPVPGGGT